MRPDRRPSSQYEERVNRVLDFIAHNLDGDLSLQTLSNVACFSPFHFHRIFQSITGETLNAHVRRVRLERAAALMKASPKRRITDIALETGFPGPTEFSRAFKSQFGRTPSSWNRRDPLEKSKICQVPDGMPFHTVEELERWKRETPTATVRRHQFPPCTYVYSRIFAPYGNNRLVDAYNALHQWLLPRGPHTIIGMSQDDPSITPAEKCRYDIGAAFFKNPPTPAECEAAGLSLRHFPAQPMVRLHCTGDIFQVLYAWQYLYRVWLPASKFAPADAPAMEIFLRLPEEIGWETFDLEACIPLTEL